MGEFGSGHIRYVGVRLLIELFQVVHTLFRRRSVTNFSLLLLRRANTP